ncbi:MAG: hypothetical protein HPY66_1513 [Firmicutes bacterium]|nr:hypothetical protein [Bacillota bacterium]
MIDYYAAYSPYAMLLIAITIACIVFGAFLCAYGFIKVGKSFLFWVIIITLLGLLCLPVMGLLALVSPTLEFQDMYLDLRRFIAMLAAVPLLCVFFGMYRGGCGPRQCGMFGLVFLIHIMCVFYLWKNRSGVLADYLPVLDFCVFSMFLIWSRCSLFAELSHVSIDSFMQELDDMVLIFEKSGKLIDANVQAKKTWPFLHEGLTINEFLESLKAMTVSKKCAEKNGMVRHEEIALSFSNGIKHYQCGTTQVKDKKGSIQATVLNFHDITEKSLLEKELADKNAELEKLNIQLKTFLDTAEKLVEEEQKAKAAKEIKEAVGAKIEKLLSDLEAVSFCNKQEKLPALIENCREAMAGVRLAMQKLMPDGGKDGKDD